METIFKWGGSRGSQKYPEGNQVSWSLMVLP